MTASKTLISILFISTACATPVFANSINSPTLNVHSNIGSRPNPNARDIQEHNMPLLANQNQPASNVASAPAQDRHAERVQPRVKSASAANSIPTLGRTSL